VATKMRPRQVLDSFSLLSARIRYFICLLGFGKTTQKHIACSESSALWCRWIRR
jgi:hypothetical protein